MIGARPLRLVSISLRSQLSSFRQRRTMGTSPGMAKLKEWFPWVERPVIMSAPMLYVSNGKMAAEVSKAGGLGLIPGGYDFTSSDNPQMSQVDAFLNEARQTLFPAGGSSAASSSSHPEPLPVGVGFIIAHPSVTSFAATAIPMLKRHKVAGGVWLFAPDPAAAESPVRSLVPPLHEAGFRVMVQVGSVTAAREALAAGADVLIAQGGDAGGHQFAKVAGIISLVPEIREAIAKAGKEKDVALIAAGGIADGRGVAAALALGADGVVIGTRFMVATETSAPEWRQRAILDTEDGGITTVKSTFHDAVQSTTVWPGMYDGRAVITKAYEDHVAGMPIEENVRMFKEAKPKGDGSRLVTWSGTGVGLVRERKPAGEIVREVRAAAIKRVQDLQDLV